MAVYREERTIDRPPAAVASAVFGDSDGRRRRRSIAGLYRVQTELDVASGDLRTTVEAPVVALVTALAVLFATLGVVSPGLRLAGLWLCALAVVAPLGHLLPGLDARPDVGRITDRRVSPVTAPAFVAAVGSLWLTLAPAIGVVAAVYCGAVVAVGAACYAVGAGWRTASVSTLWLPAAGLLPLLATFGTYAVVLAMADHGAAAAVRAGVAVAGLSIVVVTAYSYLVCRSLRTARFEPLEPPGRRLLLGAYLAVLLVVVVLLGGLAGRVGARFGITVALVLAAPLAIPGGGWLVHTVRTGTARVAAVRRADRVTVDGVTLYVVPVDRPRVAAISVPRGVVVSRSVVETLTDAELAAVVAHERHHLAGQARLARVAVAVAAIVVGRNPVAAFLDAPARERSADRYAAARAGSGPLIRALRRLERLDTDDRASPSLVGAPQALFFGPVADSASYPSVDERIAAVAGAGTG